MISLACQIFSVQPHSACVLLQSSLCCALHVQTISSYWCGAPHLSPGCQALWEGVWANFVLCPDIADPTEHGTVITLETVQCIHTFMAQVSAACSITPLTHDEYTLPSEYQKPSKLQFLPLKVGSIWVADVRNSPFVRKPARKSQQLNLMEGLS